MNDENIAQLIVELDRVAQYVPAGNTFTSDLLENEYAVVTEMRDQGKPSLRNEYRIIKVLVEERKKVLVKNKDKLVLFVPAGKIMKSIEDSLKEQFNSRCEAKTVNEEFMKLFDTVL